MEEFTEDLKYTSPDRARSSRFESKQKAVEGARGIAEKLSSTLGKTSNDDPTVLLALADTGPPPKHFYPTEISDNDVGPNAVEVEEDLDLEFTGSGEAFESSSTPQSAADWLHGKLSKEQAEELVMEAGGNGTFMVSEHKPPDTYAMTLVYLNKPSHHLISMIDGVWTINKKPYTNSTNMFTMVTTLMKGTVKGWPIILGTGVPLSASGTPPTCMPKKGTLASAPRTEVKTVAASPTELDDAGVPLVHDISEFSRNFSNIAVDMATTDG